MKRDKHANGTKDILSLKVIKIALKQASASDLLNEAFRRGLIVEAGRDPDGSGDETAEEIRMRRWEAFRREKLQERQRYRKAYQDQQKNLDIDEAMASAEAREVRRYEYVGALFELLYRERIKKMRSLGIQREDTTPEFAIVGSHVTEAIFDHLVVIHLDALNAGASDIESVWSYFIRDSGSQFTKGMIKGAPGIPPDLWSSFICAVTRRAARSFLDIAGEDSEDPADERDRFHRP